MPKLVYDIEFEIDSSSVQKVRDMANKAVGGASGSGGANSKINPLSRSVEVLRKEYGELSIAQKRAFDGMEKGALNASSGIKRLSGSLDNVSRNVGRSNKQFAGANQAVFAFNDLVQDSTQFTQGFSQGMRAIGNNVAFAGELFGNLKTRVDQYNSSLTEAQRANGEARTVFGEVRKSMNGLGGAIFAANFAFIAFQVASQLVKSELKPLNEQATATAEAFSEVASSFSDFESVAPDPFTIRARSREIEILAGQVKSLDLSFESLIASSLDEQFIGGATPITTLLQTFSSSSASFLTALGQINDEQFIAVKANEELRKELEKAKQTQEAYTNFINAEGNEAFKAFVDVTGDAEKVLLEYNSGVELTNQNLNGTILRTQRIITGLKNQNELSDSQIALLQKLLDLNEALNEEKINRLQIARDTDAIFQENDLIRQRISLLDTVSGSERARIKDEMRRTKIENDINQRKAKVYDDVAKGVITSEEAQTRITAIETNKRLRLKESEITKEQELREARIDSVKDFQKVAGDVIGALSDINGIGQQRIATQKQQIQQELRSGQITEEQANARLRALNKEAEKRFETQKKLNIASAITSSFAGFAIALADEEIPPVLREIRAGAILASGLAKVQTIRNQSFSGGGGVGGGGAGASTPSSSSGFFTRTGDADNPTFVPRTQREADRDVNVEVNMDKRGLAVLVREGNNELKSERVSIE